MAKSGTKIAAQDDAAQSEVKVSLAESDVQHVVWVNRLRMHEATHREVYFFDTPSFALAEAGLVLRARKTRELPDDATIKLRPMKRSEIASKWLFVPGMKSETDIVGARQVESCSLTDVVAEGKIDRVLFGERSIQSLFGQAQHDLIEQHAKVRPDWTAVRALGPIQARIWKIPARGFSTPVTVELWRLPNNRRVLELSYKAPLTEAPAVQVLLDELLAAQGLGGVADGDTKTRLAVRFFKGERALEAAAVAAPVTAGAVEAPARADDLTLVDGIEPKVADLLIKTGITSFAGLAAASVEKLRGLLAASGKRFAAVDPTSWPEQAALAAAGANDALAALQAQLRGRVGAS